MRFLVQRENAYGGNKASNRHRQIVYEKFNEAMEALRQCPHHSRIVLDMDGKMTTLVLWQDPRRPAFLPDKIRTYVETSPNTFIHNQVLRKTSIRRT